MLDDVVPIKYLKPFFEFVFDIYKINLEYNITETLYEDFEFVFDSLRAKMLSDDDDIEVDIF